MQCVATGLDHEMLVVALRTLDIGQLLMFLHSEGNHGKQLESVPVFHEITSAIQVPGASVQSAIQCIYTLSLHGANINQQDQEGNIALLCYLRECQCIEDGLLQAFLRCGTDLTIKNLKGDDVLGYILQANHLPKHIKARLLDYMPGIWRAVDSDDAMTVRRLINQWCNIHVIKHGMSVVDLAFSKGTENIIRVISGIGISMDLGHAVLAGDLQSVQTLLEGNRKLNVNLKNLGERGATPLFYAMCNHDWPMVDLLIKHGARLDIGMQGDKDTELPLYFAALSVSPVIGADLLHHTIPTTPVSVDQLIYKGRNVIFYSIEHDVDSELFEAILRKCSANVLTQQIDTNEDARSYALHEDKLDYVTLIDKVVREWIIDKEDTRNRNILALHGYILPRAITPSDCSESLDDPVLDFLKLLPEYEEHKTQLVEAVEEGNLITVKELLYNESWSNKGLTAYFAGSKPVGSPQPLLHKAVLREDVELVQELGQCIVYKCRQKLDTIRDQYFRTALHYAYAIDDGKQLINTLEDLGMSEHVMDKDGRSPLVFRDRKALPEMNALLQYHLVQDFLYPEPDPWSVPLPLPIMGYIAKCAHSHHSHKSHDSASLPNDQYHHKHSSYNGHKLPSSKHGKLNGHELEYQQLDSHRHLARQDVENQWDELSGRFSQLNHEQEPLLQSGTNSRAYSANVTGVSSSPHFQGQKLHGNDFMTDYSQMRDENLNPNDNISSLEHYLHVSDSDEIIAARTQALRQMLCQADDTGSELDDDLSRGDDSDSLSDISNNDEDYEGDYSDLESEGEGDSAKDTGYCTLL